MELLLQINPTGKRGIPMLVMMLKLKDGILLLENSYNGEQIVVHRHLQVFLLHFLLLYQLLMAL